MSCTFIFSYVDGSLWLGGFFVFSGVEERPESVMTCNREIIEWCH